MSHCRQTLVTGSNRVEILTDGEQFVGLGRVWIGDTLVRSGRLPIRLSTKTFMGRELNSLKVIDIQQSDAAIRVKLGAQFKLSDGPLMRDHSFDPIHDLTDWDEAPVAGKGELTIVVEPATSQVAGRAFTGFRYHYEYKSVDTAIFYLLERASWEIGGDIEGSTVFNQSACSSPVATFDKENAWSTEGALYFLDEASHFNRVMTHNLPRWASHQPFDFQFHGNTTLIGVFDHVDLIRSVIMRDAGKPELKCFDKHLFDETLAYSTSPKAILLNEEPKSLVDQKNLWTWLFDQVHNDARVEFGLKEQPPVPMMGHHHWLNFTIDTYYKDIVPACAAVGLRAIFAENFKKSDASETNHLPGGNMCCSQEYEMADSKGGTKKFAEYISTCRKQNIGNYMWTNTYVSLAAELNALQRDDTSWYCAMEDTRLKYAGAYTMVSSNLDLKNPDVRKYYVDAHKKILEDTGLEGYFIDSYYNLFFMPVNYKSGHPTTMWRESLWVMKELQDAGAGWYIESFGPFGQPQHGHPSSYNPGTAFICYYVGVGDDYTTVPIPGLEKKAQSHDPALLFYLYAHKAPYSPPLYIEGKRLDEVYGAEHRRIIADYHNLLPQMRRRYLQEDGLSVLWHDEENASALLWNFVDREAALPGKVQDVDEASALPKADRYALKASRVYRISAAELPAAVGG